MMQFFTHAPNSWTTDSPVYAQVILRVFYQDTLTGFLDGQDKAGRRLILLFFEGRVIGAYRIEGISCQAIEVPDLAEYWGSDSEVQIRCLDLPREAVRVIWQILQWFSPEQAVVLNDMSLQGYLDSQPSAPEDGIYYLLWPNAEGAVTFLNHKPLNNDTILSTANGVDVGAAVLRPMLARADEPGLLYVFRPQPESDAYRQLIARSASGQLSKSILHRYTQMVGRNLTQNLANELNNYCRANNWAIQVIGDTVDDTNLFPDYATAIKAYRGMLSKMLEHASQVLGSGLSYGILSEGVAILDERGRGMIRSALPIAV